MSPEKEVNGTFGLCVFNNNTQRVEREEVNTFTQENNSLACTFVLFAKIVISNKKYSFPNFLSLCIFCQKAAKSNKCLI